MSASQKHGAECPESRFILLMFHGIHPIEDSEADKLLRSSIYKRSIIATFVEGEHDAQRSELSARNLSVPMVPNETTCLALRSETS